MKKLLLIVVICFLGATSFANGSPESSAEKSRSQRALGTTGGARWIIYEENGKYIIPYKIQLEDPGADVNVTQLMTEAVGDYDKFTCIRFRPHANEDRFILMRFYSSGVTANPSCGWSEVGASEGFNHVKINLSCAGLVAKIIHELFHNILFNHEHMRPDRDDYIQNTWDDTPEEISMSDEKLSRYDIFSISHYSSFVLRYQNDRTWQPTRRLSRDDIQSLNSAYACPDTLQGYRPCYSAPTVVGNGTLYPTSAIYQPVDAVRLICGNKHVIEGEQYSYCEDGEFSPSTLTCTPDICKDEINNCEEISVAMAARGEDNWCRDPWYMTYIFMCDATCGTACREDRICLDTPVLYGYGTFSDHSPMYYSYNQLTVYCDDGYTAVGATTSECRGGHFDVPHFQCVPSNPPSEDDLCNRVQGSCKEIYPDKCYRFDLNVVEHGSFEPEQTFYNIHDFVQLSCDGGYQPGSSAVAQCRRGVDGSVAWAHTKLNCVRVTQPAESCTGSPIFDRRKAALSPMKFSYNVDEEVTIKCAPGFQPLPSKSVSTCTSGGSFTPSQLECIPVDDACVFTADMFGPGRKSVSPNMVYYPNGFTLNVKCLNKHYDQQQGGNHDQVTCENGHFVPQDFSCPDDRRSCKYQSIYEDLQEMRVDLPELKQVYGNGERVYVECGYKYMKMVATCTNGLFTYDNACETPHNMDIGSSTQYCDTSLMPTIYGRGSIEPNKAVYKHGDVILLRCNPGYTSSTQFGFRCWNGKFDKDELICSQENCQDYNLDCDQESCNPNSNTRNMCQLTCGICEGAACFSDSIGLSNALTPVKGVYRNGEQLTVVCNNISGNHTTETTTCVDGLFDKPMPLCESGDEQMAKYGDDDNDEGLCDLVTPDCNNPSIRYKWCPGTCRKLRQQTS